MNTLLVFVSVLVLASARPQDLGGDDGHVSVTQSSIGTYKYIVQLKDSLRSEERLADGTVNGEYTIYDANGLPQVIKYTSGKDGFRILEGPLPVAPVLPTLESDNVEVLAARSGLEVPIHGVSNTFLPLGQIPAGAPLPVDYTPEVKAARETFLAMHRAEAARNLL